MDILELAQKLNIPQEVTLNPGTMSELSPYISGLCGAEYEANAAALHVALGSDTNGYNILSAMLEAALLSFEEYARRGIPEKIFFDTMGCFPRFIREHKESFGAYAFDRWWWTGRQTSLRLFRIGALEYELCEESGKKVISVHIPSDADLCDEAVDASLANARSFFGKFFPAYGGAELYCHSWLLSPALGELLPAESRINRFRLRFEVAGFDENAEDYKLWVFKNQSLDPEEFPENTSLQRTMKAYVAQGGKVGVAWGVIR